MNLNLYFAIIGVTVMGIRAVDALHDKIILERTIKLRELAVKELELKQKIGNEEEE